MSLKNLFLPHPQTHKKAVLISWQALAVYILLFLFLRFGLEGYAKINPGVLGVSSDIDYKEVIRLTNIEREKHGVSSVVENEKLNLAASKKALNMFEENYWAHYSPSGKDPWGFIQGEGYRFIYAGENLARNFYTPQEVVDAWMASPTHRDNLLSPRYKDIGIAVSEGMLKGQKTVLVVQEFGTQPEAIAILPNNSQKTKPSSPEAKNSVNVLNIEQSRKPLFDPFLILKLSSISLISFLALLIVLDWYVLKRRVVYRISSRHLPHLIMLGLAASAISRMSGGSII